MDDQRRGQRDATGGTEGGTHEIAGFRVEGWFRGHDAIVTWSEGHLRCSDELAHALGTAITPGDDATTALRHVLRLVRATLVQIDASAIAPESSSEPVEVMPSDTSDARLSVISRGGAPTVGMVVAGELDLVTGPKLHAAVPALVPARTTGVVLDVGHVEFCDATGLSSLIRLQADLARDGAVLALERLSPSVERILELTEERDRFAAS